MTWERPPDYSKLHKRVVRARGSASLQLCDHCGKQARDWALTHGKDGEDPDDYFPLCRGCHIRYDQPSPGDPSIGQRRACQQRAKKKCPQGHDYTPENTYTIKRPGGRTARQCKICTKGRR